jgi:hypothetical protein
LAVQTRSVGQRRYRCGCNCGLVALALPFWAAVLWWWPKIGGPDASLRKDARIVAQYLCVFCYAALGASEQKSTLKREVFAVSRLQRCFLQVSINRGASAIKIRLWIDRDTEKLSLLKSSSVSRVDDLKNRKPEQGTF